MDSPETAVSSHKLPAGLTPDHPQYETILQRAYQVQRQKDTEQQILDSTEALLDTGSESATLSEERSLIASVKEHLRLFQPSDFDALIEERNINKRCGYVLCARPPRSENTDARFRIIPGRGRGNGTLDIVPRQQLEQWCSEHCARKASYIRLQLSEEPAWMRTDGATKSVLLQEELEARQLQEKAEVQQTDTIRASEVKDEGGMLASSLETLALERGEPGKAHPLACFHNVVIHENDDSTIGEPPAPDSLKDWDHRTIEGFTPRSSTLPIRIRSQIPEKGKSIDSHN